MDAKICEKVVEDRMQLDRRKLIIAASLAGVGQIFAAAAEEAGTSLYRTDSPDAILSATKALILSDTIGL
jgi:hypothetical protein